LSAYTAGVHAGDVEIGYLAHASGPGGSSQPGVVVIHDVWGLSDHTRDLARRFAAEGFAALALDLYRGLPVVKIEDPGRWIRDLSDPRMLEQVQAAIDHLAAHPAVSGHRVGVVGFCMGGMYALLAAASCRGLSAAVVFYGLLSHAHGMLHGDTGPDPTRKPREPVAAAAEIRCPLLGCFGEDDEFVPVADVDRLRAALSGASHAADVVVYPDAGHAFMNDTRPAAFRPELARRAWSRTIDFLRRELR
jgi:carboxymethylenebutenolidase